MKGAYNCLYVGSLKGGVKELNLTSNKLHDLLLADEHGESVFCRELLVASDNELWIASESGLYIYNLRLGKYVHLRSSINDPYSLSDNAIYSLCKDREGGIWIGSYFGGVNYYPRFYTNFESLTPTLRNIIRKGQKTGCMESGYVSSARIIRESCGLVRKTAD